MALGSLITWYPGFIGSNLKTGDHRLECLFLVVYIYIYTGWWFGTCFIFPNSDDDPIWLIFSGGLKPPTSIYSIYLYPGKVFWMLASAMHRDKTDHPLDAQVWPNADICVRRRARTGLVPCDFVLYWTGKSPFWRMANYDFYDLFLWAMASIA